MSSVLGFDGHAPRYASHWSADPVARRMRNEVHQTLKDLVPSRRHVLDVGCGAGCDTAWLLSKGYRVTAIDQSTGMVEATKASVAGANYFAGEGRRPSCCANPVACRCGAAHLEWSMRFRPPPL